MNQKMGMGKNNKEKSVAGPLFASCLMIVRRFFPPKRLLWIRPCVGVGDCARCTGSGNCKLIRQQYFDGVLGSAVARPLPFHSILWTFNGSALVLTSMSLLNPSLEHERATKRRISCGGRWFVGHSPSPGNDYRRWFGWPRRTIFRKGRIHYGC